MVDSDIDVAVTNEESDDVDLPALGAEDVVDANTLGGSAIEPPVAMFSYE